MIFGVLIFSTLYLALFAVYYYVLKAVSNSLKLESYSNVTLIISTLPSISVFYLHPMVLHSTLTWTFIATNILLVLTFFAPGTFKKVMILSCNFGFGLFVSATITWFTDAHTIALLVSCLILNQLLINKESIYLTHIFKLIRLLTITHIVLSFSLPILTKAYSSWICNVFVIFNDFICYLTYTLFVSSLIYSKFFISSIELGDEEPILDDIVIHQ